MNSAPIHASAGTQVVTRRAVIGPNRCVAHPAGAVGVVTRTPTRGETGYSVRFPDGFEHVLEAGDLEILRVFQERGDTPGAPFDFRSHVLLECVVGSRLYGLDHEVSDTDLRGVYLAPASMHWSLHGAPEQFEDNTAQTCHWELQKFLILALKANPTVLECLFAPDFTHLHPLGEELVAMRGRFVTRMIFQTFNGYAMSQFKRIGQDLRNSGQIRWKHAMHLLRLLLSGAAALRQGSLPVRVGAERERLLEVKAGRMSWEEVEAWRAELHRDFQKAYDESRLPDRPDFQAAENLLLRARRHAARLDLRENAP